MKSFLQFKLVLAALLTLSVGLAAATFIDGTVLISRAANNRTITVQYDGVNAAMIEMRVNGKSITSRVVDDVPAATAQETPVAQAARETEELILAQGDLGRCAEHDTPWSVSYNDRYKKIQAAHKIEGTEEWHQFGVAHQPILAAAYKTKYGEDSKKADCDKWLKEQFNGNTWSTMEPRDMVKAINILTVDTATGALPDPVSDDMPEDDDPRPVCSLCEKRVDFDDPGTPNHKACMDTEDERLTSAVTS